MRVWRHWVLYIIPILFVELVVPRDDPTRLPGLLACYIFLFSLEARDFRWKRSRLDE